MPLSYAVQLLRAPDGRTLVVLGEAHMKLATAARVGREVVSEFSLRGVETFQTRKVAGGRALWLLIHLPRLLLRVLSLGAIKGSTITDARALPHGHTVELERASEIPLALHIGSLYLGTFFFVFWSHLFLTLAGSPLADKLRRIGVLLQLHLWAVIPAIMLRRYPWSVWIHPIVAILTVRDTIMAEGAVAMLAEHDDSTAVVVMGRAHVSGFTRELVARYGFSVIQR